MNIPADRFDFDSYHTARVDYRCYQEAKGYYEDNGVERWEPTDETDLELLEQPLYGPGATTRGEIDDYDSSDGIEEF